MPHELAAVLDPLDALIALHERAEHHDCIIELEKLAPRPFSYAYTVNVRRRDSRKTVLAGFGASRGHLGRAVKAALAVMPS